MAKRRKNKEEKVDFFGILDVIDLILELIPGKAATLMLVLGVVGGGYFGYQYGLAATPECQDISCPEIICPEIVVCPEVKECPPVEDCQVCPKNVTDYTCEELNDIMKPKCVCSAPVATDSGY
ncbi:MAG: hypothetical protein QF775_01635 [archaeon]|jgi:hypothetical protein|nr:hypothetical protein [Euryarchaeota archaeon]MDP6704168.1 hypothetical protein [archaeon]MDP7260776.1 hypothetical protein [archaeon]HIK01341.1 hypothetical protein [Candidatus Undinarchaeales archaeon ERR594346 U_76725]|tara:strand:- start:42450 stop:42818 length:369 start_codon:yes stop_codon:yes gene_type:complete